MSGGGMRVGIDIGGTKTDAVAVLDEGTVAQQVRLPTGFGPDAVLGSAVAAVTRLAELADTTIDGFASIGIGVPGPVDADGTMAHSVNLGIEGLSLGDELSARLGRSVRIENDVNAAALGAYHLLERGPEDSLAYLNLGTGLAAGLVLGGRLWRGARGGAGEVGHLPVDPHGPECPCGQRGCLEMVASGSALARLWPSPDGKPGNALFAAASTGDVRALAVRERFVADVAAAVRILVLTVDVDTVVIGGGLTELGEPLALGVRSVLQEWEAASPFLRSIELSQRVALLPREFPAAAVGAALVGVAGNA